MIYKVTEVKSQREWESRNGTMITFHLNGLLDGKPEQVDINTTKAKPKVPTVGEEIECEVSKDDPKYGKTIKRVATGISGSFGGHSKPRQDDPERQAMIVRQNALTNSVAFLGKAVELGVKQKEDFTTENVLLIATKFAAFSIGELKPQQIKPTDDNQISLADQAKDEFADVEDYI